MNVVIRTDASFEIGTGHVMRCITLAKQLVHEGAEVLFICRSFYGNSISFIQSQGFHVHTLLSDKNKKHLQWTRDNWEKDSEETKLILGSLNKKIDLLIVDHYGLDIKWESKFCSVVNYIMVIDDLANRVHNCDLLLDQNYYFNMNNRYKGLVPEYCTLMLGPSYVLLRDEFLSIDPQKIKRDDSINNILIFFGGTDPTGETLKTLKVIQKPNFSHIEFNVVVGEANPKKEEIKEMCTKIKNSIYHCQTNNMAELMLKADLAISAGGATTWERCFLGLPSLIIIVAENQEDVTNVVVEKGAAYCLGNSIEVTDTIICKEINSLCDQNNERIIEMVGNCWEIINPNIVKMKLVTRNIMRLMK
ncbi:UDP-2,4-diacetamido-2,4,6-trideoxy-beta-L-altropyranose hydrolase [Metabacillus fastidiosus]|uniref:UDP-2,4-diacetamido-2,4, 6-trideoxy-beta-L-altropyranose hydrolase n=1 Tax=Metabacillus fastidiosus TaxID=1458 RepID=A0ABU6P074_9BACI|nr:UDP-2,4-diacetamido-2,4,6-trideoxy-beta-L-altropyranose hydrolase [Metabacillus fastidiosus]MED4402765.1 UDP-2,4-diacetamido-2,4,6-trideoxy-beta-L-altropyranose hydrolase [Metabacillus fastidiosus]